MGISWAYDSRVSDIKQYLGRLWINLNYDKLV